MDAAPLPRGFGGDKRIHGVGQSQGYRLLLFALLLSHNFLSATHLAPPPHAYRAYFHRTTYTALYVIKVSPFDFRMQKRMPPNLPLRASSPRPILSIIITNVTTFITGS